MSMQVDVAVAALSEEPEEPVTMTSSTVDETPIIDETLVVQLVGQARGQGVSVNGEGGLLAQLTMLVVESALEGGLTDHLGCDRHVRGGSADGNARNGTRSKTVLSKAGPVGIDVPRDRAGMFTPAIVKKRQRRLGSIEDVVVSLSARGMTHGDIAAHLADVYGSQVSKTTISFESRTRCWRACASGRTGRWTRCVRWCSSTRVPREGARRLGRQPADLRGPGGHRRGQPGHPGPVGRGRR